MFYERKTFNKLHNIWELTGEDTDMSEFLVYLSYVYPTEIWYNNKKITKKQISNGHLYNVIKKSTTVDIKYFKDVQTKEVAEVEVVIS